jgi:Carboxypeptidase regulatory-like domain
MPSRPRAPLLFALIFLLAGFSGYAQIRSRRVTGIVTDKRGNPLPKSVVHLKNLATIDIRTFLVQEGGEFRFNELNPDIDYEIHAEYFGRISKTVLISRFNEERHLSVRLMIPVE